MLTPKLKTGLLALLAALALNTSAHARDGISAEDQRPDARTRTTGSQWSEPKDYDHWRLSAQGGIFSYLSQEMRLQDDFTGIGGGWAVEYLIRDHVGIEISHQFSSASRDDTSLTTHMIGLHGLIHSGKPDKAHLFLGAGAGLLLTQMVKPDDTASNIGLDGVLGYHYPLGDWLGIVAQVRATYVYAEFSDSKETVNLSNLLAGAGLSARF